MINNNAKCDYHNGQVNDYYYKHPCIEGRKSRDNPNYMEDIIPGGQGSHGAATHPFNPFR